MQKLQIVFFDAGGGHRSAAQALAEVIRTESRPWDVELVNLDHVLEPIDFVYKATGVHAFEFYNWTLRMGWTSLQGRLLPATHRVIRVLHRRQVDLLRAFWSRTQPDLVVSVVPHFGRAIFEGLHESCQGARLVTILTDLADCPPHFWLERQDQHFICGSARAIEQARLVGAPDSQIWRVSGMIVHPKFYEPVFAERPAERIKLGLLPELPTAVVLFGGYGSSEMVTIVQQLAAARSKVQLILLCGRNARLARRLHEIRTPFRKVVTTFTTDVAWHMRLSDVFIGKPGPGSVSEALASGLPVIVERGANTMLQERYNIDWLEEQNAGIGLNSFKNVAGGLEYVLRPDVYARLRQNIEGLRNRAVFEIPNILDQISRRPARTGFEPSLGNSCLGSA
jgi:Glycosyltransferase family 28 C-terminal domain/Monogalactosyldiacylglycerol (MGDG) synthase